MDTNDNYNYIKYNDFWQNSLQRLEGITKNLEQNFYKLEKQYYDFDKYYRDIITEINILSSIYSSHNNLKGREYILKLKAVLSHYRKKYSHESINFKIIHFLNSKINKLREFSIEEFPKMDHSYTVYEDFSKDKTKEDINIKRYNELRNSSKYKWLTFQRNGSWFITQYSKFQIIRQDEYQLLENNDSVIKIKHNNDVIPVIDFFSKFSRSRKEPVKIFLIIKSGNELKYFAVNKLGKIIMADTDFISTNLKGFEKNKISLGRFRIFGKNHIYL
jgi:hypothetical protein